MGEGRQSKEDEEQEQKPIAEDKLERSPDQLTLIAFDSSGEGGQSLAGLPPRQADNGHQVLCHHSLGLEQEFRDCQARDRDSKGN